ncbi:alpha/beta hydrolase family protein [Hymenobacter sp. GOD-10R]|uniref:alpha/beta hydrolase family protein n=1 Tax=Hymenobacter sp. GOD-10R TaxID=3093922 RepID=UPI002D79B90B|nr:acetylxylan esterase [Hymenobacter sp. GOD-10R]WRQ27636.1 acetylxylan esterase [Hymenobacter sp. GOD-10R]
MRYPLLASLFLGCALIAKAQVNSSALAWRNNLAYNSYLMRTVHQQYAERLSEIADATASKKAILRYQESRRARYRSILGDLPKKTNLNARVVGTSPQKGFRVERIIFESAPHRYVTGNLYLPEGKGPFPVTLSLSGHGMNGKVSDQRVGALFALNGVALFAVDPIAQGERLQLVDSKGNPLTRGSTTEHTLLNAGSNLVGTSVAAYEYWDNTRAIDYLETRNDLDKNKIGCIGSSGGGTQTTYLIALDDRIKVATVCSYVSRRERVLELSGPSDGCQHIPYEGKEHLEISDFLALFAPKPLLIMSGLYDFVDYWGATQSYEELKKVYTTFDAHKKVNLFTAESGHGMPQPKREAAITWFRTWFANDATPVQEGTIAPIPEKELLCTTTGQITTTFPDAVSMPQYNEGLAKEYATQRAAFMKQDKAAVTKQVLSLLGVEMPKEKISVEPTGTTAARTYTLNKYQLVRAGQMPVPCLVLVPEKVTPAANVVLYLNAAGKESVLNDETTVGNFMNRGDILVLADLRGFGETTDPAELNDLKYWSKEYRNAMLSLHTGQPIMGQRVIDVLSLVDFMSTDPSLKGHPIKLIANSLYGPTAIHAAYLDDRIKSTEVARSFKSFEQLIQEPMQNDAYTNVLYGVLKYYDLKDLMDKAGGRIRFVD